MLSNLRRKNQGKVTLKSNSNSCEDCGDPLMICWLPEGLPAVPCTHSLSPVLKMALLRSCCCPCLWSHWSHGAGISQLLGSSLSLHQWPLLGSLQVLWLCLTFSPWPLQSWGFFHCCWGCNFTSSLSWSQAKAALRDPFSSTTRRSSSLSQLLTTAPVCWP